MSMAFSEKESDAIARRVDAILRFEMSRFGPSPAPEPAAYCGYTDSEDGLEKLVLAFCEGRLEDDERESFLEHAAGCSFCGERLSAAMDLCDASETLASPAAAGPSRAVPEAHREAIPTSRTDLPRAAEVILSLISDLRYVGGEVIRSVRTVGAEILRKGEEQLTPAPAAMPIRGARGQEATPKLTSYVEFMTIVGDLRVECELSRVEAKRYRVRLRVKEADGQLCRRTIDVQLSLRGREAGLFELIRGEAEFEQGLPVPFGEAELTLLDRTNGNPLGLPLRILEENDVPSK